MQVSEIREKIINNVSKVIFGKEEVIEKIISAFMIGGHVLMEDVPGTGKTMLARALSISLGLDFKRVQFTPDLLPTDLTGLSIYKKESGNFEFKEGPIFTDILLVDEINRATPKTQSALLEAMAEGQVTVDGVTRKLSDNFFVIATQNPIEYQGTFPLPEAQLDRFAYILKMGYPTHDMEIKMLTSQMEHHPIEDVENVITPEEISFMKNAVKHVTVDETIKDYIAKIVEHTRNDKDLYLGASPRASISLMKGAMSYALVKGRDYVIPDDVKAISKEVLGHRLILTSEARVKMVKVEDVIERTFEEVPVPVTKKDEI
ncbi:AAA family ATPase [Mesoaciditoga lauensis]|uniref:AAA family ATPase n=1 Tax=Mesoaciditoga lauensis TaxID=1495039 RepID=UPI001B802535|nr:MoxR family ATPase [Mesoaciditoga lauensis]